MASERAKEKTHAPYSTRLREEREKKTKVLASTSRIALANAIETENENSFCDANTCKEP